MYWSGNGVSPVTSGLIIDGVVDTIILVGREGCDVDVLIVIVAFVVGGAVVVVAVVGVVVVVDVVVVVVVCVGGSIVVCISAVVSGCKGSTIDEFWRLFTVSVRAEAKADPSNIESSKRSE